MGYSQEAYPRQAGLEINQFPKSYSVRSTSSWGLAGVRTGSQAGHGSVPCVVLLAFIDSEGSCRARDSPLLSLHFHSVSSKSRVGLSTEVWCLLSVTPSSINPIWNPQGLEPPGADAVSEQFLLPGRRIKPRVSIQPPPGRRSWCA